MAEMVEYGALYSVCEIVKHQLTLRTDPINGRNSAMQNVNVLE